MKKLRNLSVFTLISMVMLFLLIMPAFASGSDTCTVSSDGTQTCVATSPIDEKPATVEDSIGKDDGIRYFANEKSNLATASASDFTGSAIGWVSGLTVLASFAGAAVYALRSRKNQK